MSVFLEKALFLYIPESSKCSSICPYLLLALLETIVTECLEKEQLLRDHSCGHFKQQFLQECYMAVHV